VLVVEPSTHEIRRASRIVKDGGVCIFPTDTVYALGCDPRNKAAVDRVYRLKGKEKRPSPILCDSRATAMEVARLSPIALWLADKFWPGPMTIVGPCLDRSIVGTLIAKDGSVGVRVPNLGSCLLLAKMSGGLLLGTSANITGRQAPHDLEGVPAELRDHVDIVIDGGSTVFRSPSTVVKPARDSVKVIRDGAIKKSDIIRALRWYN